MYVAAPFLDRTTLLQGDIIRDVFFLGAISYTDVQRHMPIQGTPESRTWSVSSALEVGYAMILSHSCEVARENGVKVTSIILAPLRDVSKATKPEKINELRTTNLIDAASPQASYLKYFFVDPFDPMPFREGAVTDFSKCFSLRKTSYDFLLERKVQELTQAARTSMSLKLALYFHRDRDRSAEPLSA